jgi:hypothetical protein
VTLKELISELSQLSLDERKMVVQLLTQQLDEAESSETPRQYHLLELEGVGAALWQGIDAQSYGNELRSEWDHR